MHLFFSVGEPSGDQHAAELLRHLKRLHPDVQVSGFGGPELAAAGQSQMFRLTDMAVMGIMAVLPLIFKFWKLYRQAGEFLKREKPDAVVLVDFPGFNWWIAKAARRAGVPVYYYCPPQLWAWASWRIAKVRRNVDCVLSVLPFEAQWYRDQGIDVEYVGHPFFDEVAGHPLHPQQVQAIQQSAPVRIGILPGSRKQEVHRNFPIMLEVMTELHRRHPQVRFPIACYKTWHRDRCAELLARHPVSLPVDLHVGETPAVVAASDCCLMVSGSVSLELLARRTPAVVVYRAGAVMAFFARLLITCRYMTLPNLIAGRELMPEFPCVRQHGPHVRKMITILDRWLSEPAELQAVRGELSQLADEIVQAGGLACAAETLLARIAPDSLPAKLPQETTAQERKQAA
jgi:lipid-A-disaccharide synthase